MAGSGSGADGWLRRFLTLCLARRRAAVLACTGAVAGVALTTVGPLITRHVVDTVIVARRGSAAPWLLLLLAVAAGQFGASFVRRWWAGKIQWGIERDLRIRLHDAIQRIDGRRADRLRTGQLLSRAVNDVTVVQRLTSMLPLIAQNSLTVLASLAVMVVLSPLLSLVALAAVPLLVLLARYFRARLFPLEAAVQQRTADLSEAVEANAAGVRVVKGFGQEAAELGRFAVRARALFDIRMRRTRVNANSSALGVLPEIAQVAVVLLGGWMVVEGWATLGTFVAFTSYLATMLGPIRTVVNVLTESQEARSALVRIFEITDTEPELTDRPDARPLPDGPLGVHLDGVRFGHDPERPALDGLDLRLEPGETLALVGGSGTGKSTVAALVPRLYDADGGTVRVGGQDVRDTALAELRAAVGIVFEETLLFSESVRDNIRYGRPDATDAEVEAAAAAAEADGFVRELPDGYDTVLGESGQTLSGGQRQRLALARALLTDPRVLILDDATSAVDPQVESRIHARLEAELAGRTVLLIAHRRSTLRLADRIAVLDGGRILDTGTHTELTARCARYRQLVLGEDAPGAERSVPAPRAAVEEPAESEPVLDPGVDEDRARAADPRFTLGRLLRPFRAAYGLALALVLVDSLLLLAAPALVRASVDRGVARHSGSALLLFGALALAANLVDWAVFRGEFRLIGRTTERMLYELRTKFFAQLQRLGLDWFERESAGAILTRMTNDVGALGEFAENALLNLVVCAVVLVGALAAMFVMGPPLALCVLAVAAPVAAASWIYARISNRQYGKARTHLALVNTAFQECVAGVRVVQAFGRQRRNSARFTALAERQRREQMRSQLYLSVFFSLIEFLLESATALIVGVGAALVLDGSMTTGAIVAFLMYASLVFGPIRQSSTFLDQYQRARIGVARIAEVLRAEPSIAEPAEPHPVPARLRGEIVLDDVHYAYGGAAGEALRGISVRIDPGTTVAVVGETGAGKSTLVKLVARLYAPSSGAVRADGTDLAAADGTAYRRRLGWVPQEAYLFGATVGEAIGWARPEAGPEEVEAAARAVGAHAMISGLADGYGHALTERGRNLSAGQRQLVALARAHLVQPDILLLDEATAALDLATEAAVHRAVDTVTGTPTTLVIAHRLATARTADRILVLDGGRLVEDGSHRELLAAGGRYAELWAAYDDPGTDAREPADARSGG